MNDDDFTFAVLALRGDLQLWFCRESPLRATEPVSPCVARVGTASALAPRLWLVCALATLVDPHPSMLRAYPCFPG